jgi:hypothetical protein
MAATLDRPRGPLPQGIAVEQQRDHHRRIVCRATMTVGAVSAIELAQIDLADDIKHQPREMIVIKPLPQTRRQQQRLLAITPQEVLRHDQSLLTRPDTTKPAEAGFAQQPQQRGFRVSRSQFLVSICALRVHVG